MIEHYIRKPHAVRRMRSSYLGWIFEDYISYLDKQGYTNHTIQAYCQAVEHFGQYCSKIKISKETLNKNYITRFTKYHLPKCDCKTPNTRNVKTIIAALHRLFDIIAINSPEQSQANKIEGQEIDLYIDIYDNYLKDVCGLSENTRLYRRRYASAFLEYLQLKNLSDIEKTSIHQTMGFVKSYALRYKSGSVRAVTGSLKRFLNFLLFKGYDVKQLISSVPKLPNWTLSNIPKYFDDNEMKRFLASFDVTSASGKRDYAMARCFTDLGLRCSEVAGITLCDLNWQEGSLRITKGKSHQDACLPLTQSLGDAIVDYLSHGRPSTSTKSLFVYHRAPLGQGVGTETVRNAMRRAYRRAGFHPIPSTHILRRTFATKLLHSGIPLKEIADLLRHKSLNTTAIYTKVDLPQLQRVVMPWFGGVR